MSHIILDCVCRDGAYIGSVLFSFGSFWFVLVHLVHFGSFRFVLVHFSSFWFILVCLGSFWFV